MMEDIYKENIIDHYQNPRNFGELDHPSTSHEEVNSFCGDQIRMDLKIKNDKIVNVKFSGKGCAISVASASMLSEKIMDLPIEEVKKIQTSDIEKMVGVPLTPTRLKCALLAWEVLQKALQKSFKK